MGAVVVRTGAEAAEVVAAGGAVVLVLAEGAAAPDLAAIRAAGPGRVAVYLEGRAEAGPAGGGPALPAGAVEMAAELFARAGSERSGGVP